MRFPSGQRLLVIYSGVLTLVFAGSVLLGATSTTRNAAFDQITVHRINVVEPDGTIRMTISDAAEAPGTYMHNKEYPRPSRKASGILFMNDEGSEAGGLVYNGRRDKDGKVTSQGHLSFNNYDQDQTIVLSADQTGAAQKTSYLQINDEPDWDGQLLFDLQQRVKSLPDAQQKAAYAEFFRTHQTGKPRIFLGTSQTHASVLALEDAEGRPRIMVMVGADGKPELQFLDANGKVIDQLPHAANH